MAPTPKSYYHSSSSNYDSGSSGLSAGAIVGIVIVVLIAIFLCTFAYKVYKARKTGQPVNYGTIFVDSLKWAACGACLCCIALFASESGGNDNNGNDNGGAGEANQEYASVPQMQMPEPQANWQPQMNWQPVQSEAQDGIQV
ncbi:uncharacterized protein PV09_00110 [Verruconis gallopava]|uniref:Uncharacterized protein n=1 Tax=Verruconis gallopava TaxID=253628 RepID=A0A0D2BCQ6_9PEZI|nr:uncharacterized protein PV09_00110 [Verruconis gallopava]KIW09179.1 hypothetical protein PV09_00110 [Verruconis gallopava]